MIVLRGFKTEEHDLIFHSFGRNRMFPVAAPAKIILRCPLYTIFVFSVRHWYPQTRIAAKDVLTYPQSAKCLIRISIATPVTRSPSPAVTYYVNMRFPGRDSPGRAPVPVSPDNH